MGQAEHEARRSQASAWRSKVATRTLTMPRIIILRRKFLGGNVVSVAERDRQ